MSDDWRPIETAPKDGTIVWVGASHALRLAFWRSGKEYESVPGSGGGWIDKALAEGRGPCGLEHQFHPTHWMPIPRAPE